MRMSSGSSRWKLKPRPGASNCIDDTPRSASAPSTARSAAVEHVVDRAVVGVHQLDAIAPRARAFRGARERVGIAVEADDACAPASSSARECRRGRRCSRRTGRRARAQMLERPRRS
jgi:hypothetical protein